ncbi:hypothetical protein [Pseudomonas viridiflava]|uniref:hypothetical protein n=1 Tax=Pseudomonas viridiflava TaxID=33069 RepID=UPI000F0333CD|nr:hypothetical protein [Pseudomonas viridiflava]
MGRFFVFLQDRYLDVLVLLAFLLLCVVKIKFAVPPEWEGSWAVGVLSSAAFEDIVGSILASIVAAYIFYLFIDVIPKKKRMAETDFALDNILASIVSSYKNLSGGHTSIDLDRHNLKVLDIKSLKDLAEKVKDDGIYDGLLSVVLHVRYIQHILDQGTMLAESLSSRHAMFWIQICAHARDLAGMFEQMPQHPLFVSSDVFGDKQDEYACEVGYREYQLRMIHYRDRLRVRGWLLLEDILFWKQNYSSARTN